MICHDLSILNAVLKKIMCSLFKQYHKVPKMLYIFNKKKQCIKDKILTFNSMLSTKDNHAIVYLAWLK